MPNRCLYISAFKEFLDADPLSILGTINSNYHGETLTTTIEAWASEIDLLQNILTPWKYENAQIVFEYEIPRLGKRIDVILLLRGIIFCLEFKIGQKTALQADLEQVMDYALDLKNFHKFSHDKVIVPILIPTQHNKTTESFQPSVYNDKIYNTLISGSTELQSLINNVLSHERAFNSSITIENWIISPYAPTPTIIEAAKALYENHSVEDITRHEADKVSTDRTINYILNVIQESKEEQKKSICFVTGVPGAGKTLVGLNVAVQQESNEDLAVYLSGNGPLVAVLTEALTRDKQAQEKARGIKITKKTAESEVKRFIQIIHRYRDNMLNKVKLVDGELKIDPTKELKDKFAGYGEVENIAIFDEAQRSWDKEHIASWLKRKKGFADFPMSEGEFLIWSLDQRKDWAVIVCLVGGGQEINTGEAGIGEWIRALNETFPDWQVYISSQLTAKEYAEGKVEELLQNNPHVIYSDDLHLAVSMRSFRAESLSNLVHNLLDGNISKAREIYNSIADRYPIVLTRDLKKAKDWLKQKARGHERYGMVVSSKAYRLKPLAIDVRCKPDTVHWFLDDINDVRSSLFLEDAASEFDIQGLELDWTCLVWDGDLRRNKNSWEYYEFNGGCKWNRINKEERKSYQLNAYRVLLTRARQGMIICVPEGNPEDSTRLPEFYDGIYDYLKSLGIKEI
ncbi:DUF2075 domain-containing protein [bacterium]|nr:DUF2075 domain-containing protein [bacterium]